MVAVLRRNKQRGGDGRRHGGKSGGRRAARGDIGQGGAAVSFARPARQARRRRLEADGDSARPVARLFAGRRRAGARHRQGSFRGVRLYDPRQYGRRHHQRHRDPRARRSRRACGEAGDGRQGRAVQAVRRHRFHRSRDRCEGGRRIRQRRALSRPLIRRHQSRRHQGAGVFRHRGAATRSHGHSGLS